jgi:hypothetical protein
MKILRLITFLSFCCSNALSQPPKIVGYSGPYSLEETLSRKVYNLEAMHFGSHGFLNNREVALSGYLFLAGVESVTGGGYGFSIQSAILPPLEIGIGYGAMNGGGFPTRVVSLNAQKKLLHVKKFTILLQAAFGYQYDVIVDSTISVGIKSQDPLVPEILLQNFTFYHSFVHVIFTINKSWVNPILDLGALVTWYKYEGFECNNVNRFDLGRFASEGGSVFKRTLGLGIAFGQKPLRFFWGIKFGAEGPISVGSLTLVF